MGETLVTPRVASWILFLMENLPIVLITIELEGDLEQFCGWLTPAGGERHRFESWLELASRLQELRHPLSEFASDLLNAPVGRPDPEGLRQAS